MKQSVRFLMLLMISWAAHESNPCDVPVRNVCVPAGENVHIPCPNVTGKSTLKLIKDQEMISKLQCIEKENCTVQNNRNGVEVHQGKQQRSVGFMLVGVTESSQGMYRCEGKIFFPPPVKEVPSSETIQVLVIGHICRSHQSSLTHDNNSNQAGLNWIWILTVALLSVYSAIVTILVIVAWVKLKNADSQSDYMNTKPRAPRDARGKRQLQKPVPRHF